MSVESFTPLLPQALLSDWKPLCKSKTTNAFGASHGRACSYLHSIDRFRRYATPDMVNKKPAEDSSSSAFEQRMRKLALSAQNNQLKSSLTSKKKKNVSRQRLKKKKKNSGKPAYINTIHTLQEYKREVADERDRLVVVRFYAEWCKACRAVAPFYYRLAEEFENEIKFIEVPITDKNANIHQGLEVPSIPFGHIYHPTGGLVEERRLKRMDFPTFDKILRSYAKGSCELVMDENNDTPPNADSVHFMFLNPYGEDGK